MGPASNSAVESLVPKLFEALARERPDALAVAAADGRLTYGELNARANRIAHGLIRRGVEPGEIVAIAAERSAATVAAILGVLKAGGAYLPLGPDLPPQRIDYMLADAGVRFRLAGPAPAGSAADDQDPGRPIDPGALAYVIYTSGSTGAPKGVMVSHANLAYSTGARRRYYEAPVDRFLLLSPFAFDSSVAGAFWTLTTGGRLVIPDDEAVRDPAQLARLIDAEQVTHLLGLPSLYRLILESDDRARLENLRTVVLAGETFPPSLVFEHVGRAQAAALYNEYGPTEASVWSTVHQVEGAPGPRVPIGRPIPGARAYVVEEDRLAAEGQPGELYVGGPGVAIGYLNRPDLTEERFVRRDFGAGEERLYRTGDLVQRLPDGAYEFLGRLDHQVKSRGHRVELGEIEARLVEHPQVREAAVVMRARDGEERMAAFVAARPEGVDASALRAFLRESLPEHMTPASIEVLPALPLGPTGKVDRAALAAREAPGVTSAAAEPPLASPTQADLAKVWRELLGGQEVGPDDGFFDLGGSSLDAVRLVNRINQRWGLRLAVREIYDRPGLAALAERVDQARAAVRTTEPRIVTLRAGRSAQPPLYFYHDGPIEVRLAELLDARPAFAIEQVWPDAWVGGADGARPHPPSAAEIVAPVVDQLLSHAGGEPFVLAGYSTRGVLACELGRQAAQRGGRPQLVVLFDSWARLPSRLDVAKGRWRRGMATADPAATAHLWRLGYEAVRAGLHRSRQVVWPALGLRVPNASGARYTTHVTEDGRVLPWGEAEPVYLNILRTFVASRLPCRGLLFVAEQHMPAGRELDPSQGWAGAFRDGLDLVPVATDHAFADAEALAGQVRAGLERALGRLAQPARVGQASLEPGAARA